MRPIDADRLNMVVDDTLKRLDRLHIFSAEEVHLHCAFFTLTKMINDAPTVDAQRTARWVDDNCSECGCYVYHGAARNYCPNCGARMEGIDERPAEREDR